MIEKKYLTSVIDRYNLAHRNEQVKWRIKDNTLTVYFGEKGRAGMVKLKEFNFEDCELAIFNTHQFSKLLSVTSGTLILTAEKVKSIYTKLHIADANFELSYSLADILMISKISYYKDLDEYAIELDLDKEQVTNLVKAKNALSDVETMLVNTSQNLDGTPVAEFIFGDNTGFSNKISYQIIGKVTKQDLSIPFDSTLFRDILKVNSDFNTCKFKMSENGLIKLEFDNEHIYSEYFIARNE